MRARRLVRGGRTAVDTRAMRPWETLASVVTPEGLLELRRRSEHDWLITIAGRILMTSVQHRSEDALAVLACKGLRADARVLVSGLGMGFTLRAALSALGPAARVEVAELNEVVVAWCRTWLAPLTLHAALDPRVTVAVEDVALSIARAAKEGPAFDAIVLDMYEGPQAKVADDHPLYGVRALARTRTALVPRGVLTVWCESASAGFDRALRKAGFEATSHREGRGARTFLVVRAVRVG